MTRKSSVYHFQRSPSAAIESQFVGENRPHMSAATNTLDNGSTVVISLALPSSTSVNFSASPAGFMDSESPRVPATPSPCRPFPSWARQTRLPFLTQRFKTDAFAKEASRTTFLHTKLQSLRKAVECYKTATPPSACRSQCSSNDGDQIGVAHKMITVSKLSTVNLPQTQ